MTIVIPGRREGARAASASVRVGVDVGGTKVEAVAIASDGRVVASTRRATAQGEAGVMASIADAITGLQVARVASIGVGIPGRIEADRVRDAVNLGVTDLALVDMLEQRFDAPASLENDVNAAALGASAARGADGSMAYLNLGTGVAAGIVMNGRVLSGESGVAGEIGHLSIDPAGQPCRCGQRGCIEALAGGAAIARRWGGDGLLPVRDAMDAADAGDERAAAIVADLGSGVAAAVRVLALSIDPAAIVIGGGISRLGVRLERVIAEALRLSASGSPFLRSLRLGERVELLVPGQPVGAIGAALAAGRADC